MVALWLIDWLFDLEKLGGVVAVSRANREFVNVLKPRVSLIAITDDDDE